MTTRSKTPAMTRVGLLLCLLAAACAGKVIETGASAHGNFLEATADNGATAAQAEHRGVPTVLLVERAGVRAIDPADGHERWWQPLPLVGHPVASHHTVYLPLRGHKLAAVDRRSGKIRWIRALPGEALTGLTVSEPFVVAAVVGGPRGRKKETRSRLVAMHTEDAGVRWRRRTAGRFGVPAVRGRSVVVPLDGEVLALSRSSGRELARVALPQTDLERVSADGDALVLGGGNAFVHLAGITGGTAPAAQRVDSGFGWLFRPIEGLDPGFDDDERLRLSVRFAASGEAPRGGVLLARRAVVAIRLLPDGRPVRAKWVHRATDDHEYVAMDVGKKTVTLVAEDGAIVRLDAKRGTVLRRFEGRDGARGALMLDVDAAPAGAEEGGPSKSTSKSKSKSKSTARPAGAKAPAASVRDELAALLAEHDPRLLPAQHLAADLLWRAEDPQARAEVEQLAAGAHARSGDDTSASLQAYALTLTSRPWGRDGEGEVEARLKRLALRPSFLYGTEIELGPVARAAVHSGRAEMVPHLVDHLLHPATRATDLAEVARALSELGGAEATVGLAAFVRRYHADPEVVFESRALHVAVDHLAAGAGSPADSGGEARDDEAHAEAEQTLSDVLRDPFTEPELRAYIAQRMGPTRSASTAAAPDEPKPDAPVSSPDGFVPAPAAADGEPNGSGRVPSLPAAGL